MNRNLKKMLKGKKLIGIGSNVLSLICQMVLF